MIDIDINADADIDVDVDIDINIGIGIDIDSEISDAVEVPGIQFSCVLGVSVLLSSRSWPPREAWQAE